MFIMGSNYSKRPFWQWVIIYLIIGGVVYAGIYYFFLAKNRRYSYNQPVNPVQPTPVQGFSTPSPTTQKDMQSQNTITLTSSGFSPASLTVKVGDTVTWENRSGLVATVDSDPHPVHTNYPPLNLGNFSDGEELTFTFDKPGTYGYHNHLNTSEKGTIIVE